MVKIASKTLAAIAIVLVLDVIFFMDSHVVLDPIADVLQVQSY